MSQTRRLAAILAADVAGYSRLMGADEEGTLERLKALRRELVDPKIAEHRGRIVKTTGDGLLVEFASVVDALRCSVEVQTAVAERNAPVAAENRIEFRMGVHQGDIVVEEGDIFGDGVNVAARLEGLAEPGGICASARVQEDAAGKLDLGFEDIGEQQLKNIARPVRVYRVRPVRNSAAVTRQALALPDKPSIALLPFQNRARATVGTSVSVSRRLCTIKVCLGFEPVWGFSCQVVVLVYSQFFVRSGKAVLHPVACDQVRGARGRGQGTETLAKLAACRLAALVFRSAWTPEHAEG
jgi:class 3 adenylate cyclase